MTEKVFKTVEEQTKAMDEISIDAPDDVKRDSFKYQEWRKNTEQEIADVRNAKIDPEAQGEPEKTGEPEKKPDLSKPDESVNLRRELDTYHKERIQLQDEAGRMKADYEKKLDELSNKTKELEEQIKNPPKPETPPEDHEVSALESDLEAVNREMGGLVRDDDPEKYDKAVNRKIDIGNKLTLLRVKRDKEFQAQHKAELQKMKDDAKKRDEDVKTAQEQEKAERERKAMRDSLMKEVNSFAGTQEEFKSDLNYEQMFHEYDRFAEKVAADYWGKPAYKVDARDKELAMIKYKQQNPMIIESLKKKGIEEPKNFKVYDTLSKVVQLKQGYKLNEDTGEFYEYKDGVGNRVVFPDMDAAYDHLKKLTGKSGQELIQAAKDGAEGATAAMNQRSDPRELDGGQQKQVLDTEVKPEEAIEMLGKKGSNGQLLFDDEKIGDLAEQAHRAGKQMPAIVKEYNKYVKALGQRSIEETLGLT